MADEIRVTRTPYGKFPVDRKIYTEAFSSESTAAITKAKSWACEAEVVRYETDKPRILWVYASRLKANGWTSDRAQFKSYFIENLNSDITEKYYRTHRETSVKLRCDSGKPVYVDTLAILAHNLTTSARIRVIASEAPVPEHGRTYDFSITPSRENTIWVSPHMPGIPYRYWKIEITDDTNPDGFLRIGTLVYGSADTIHNDISGNITVAPRVFSTGFVTSGNTGISNTGRMKRAVRAKFVGLQYDSEDMRKLNNIFFHLNTARRALWIFDARSALNTDVFHVFGKLKKIPEQAMAVSDTSSVDLSLEIDEAL